MSVVTGSGKPSPERQMMETMSNIFSVGYALDEEDRSLIRRMVQWGANKDGLSIKEIEILQKNGFMDKDNIFMVPDEFWFKGLVLPSYWLKCLLAFEGL